MLAEKALIAEEEAKLLLEKALEFEKEVKHLQRICSQVFVMFFCLIFVLLLFFLLVAFVVFYYTCERNFAFFLCLYLLPTLSVILF